MIWLRLKLLGMLLTIGFIFIHCNPEHAEVTEFEFKSSQSNLDATKLAFQNTVYKLTRQYCASCHTAQAPQHASSDPDHAMSELLDNFKVNFDNIPSSRIVAKIRDENHACWSNCNNDAAEMEKMVEEWYQVIKVNRTPGGEFNEDTPITEVCVDKIITEPGANSVDAFSTTFYPLTRNNCVNCHAGNGPGPTAHASADPQIAHDGLVGDGSGILIDFTTPADSGIVRKVKGGHNCGGAEACANLATQMEAAIVQWQNATTTTSRKVTTCSYTGGGIVNSNEPLTEAGEPAPSNNGGEFQASAAMLSGNFQLMGDYIMAPNNNVNFLDPLSDPNAGKASFNFNIDDAGEYEILAEVNGPSGSDNSFHVQMDNGNINPFRFKPTNGFEILKVSEQNADGGVGVDGTVYTTFALGAGRHTVHFWQREDGTQLKKIIIQPRGGGAGKNKKELTFDLSGVTGITGNKLVMDFAIIDDFSYEASNLRMINGSGLHIKNLKIYINGLYNPQHATFTVIDSVLQSNDEIITPYSMILLKDKGEFQDTIGIKFEEISIQN